MSEDIKTTSDPFEDEPLLNIQFSITKDKRIRCRKCKSGQTFKNGCTFGKHYIFFHVPDLQKK